MPDPTALVTVDDALLHLGIDTTDTDALLQLPSYVTGVTSAVENHKNEVIVPRTITDRLVLEGRQTFRLPQLPVMELTSIESLDGSTSWDPDDMDVDPSGLITVLRGSYPAGRCKASYRAGYAVIPEHYKRGALIILQHAWETQRGVGGVLAGVIGAEEQVDPRSFFYVPNKAKEALGPPRPVVF